VMLKVMLLGQGYVLLLDLVEAFSIKCSWNWEFIGLFLMVGRFFLYILEEWMDWCVGESMEIFFC